jgi:DNA recombination protein RmuC
VTIVLAIAVLALAAALVYLIARQPEEQAPLDHGPAIQEATAKAVADLLRVNEESRKLDTQAAEAALQKREAEFRRLTEPIGKNLERIEKEVSTMSRDRRSADGAVRTLLDEMKIGLGDLGTQTGTLVKALRQPQTRGQWGEVQLKRCVEIAGMTEHVDFELQQTFNDGEGILRPDAVVMLPAGRRVVIDSKVPLDAYLEVLEAEDDASRKGELIRHARQVRDHITKLASKRYQDQFDSGETPDFVVCFMPSEAALHAAFEAEPSLYDYALEQKILIATPTTLVGLLRTVELGWRQEQIAEQAQEIASASRELHSRMGAFLEHFAKAGRQLNSATKSFDDAVGSLESRIMPQLRRIEEMGAASGKELEEPHRVDRAVRPILAEVNDESKATDLPPQAHSDAA